MEFKTLLNQMATLLHNLTLRQKIVAVISMAALVGFLVFLTLYKGSSVGSIKGYSVLFENTSAGDSALIIQQLEKEKVPYKIVNEGTIAVPSEVVYKERIAIAALGIPKNSKVGFEIFDKTEFGATDFEQKIKYVRALEGELARTIESLAPIAKASVHIAIPKESVFTQKATAPTASIVLNIRSGMSLSLKQIVGIKNLVAASIAQLSPENVSIVDQNGESLGNEQSDLSKGELVKSQIRYKKEYESNFEQKIMDVLAPIIGGIEHVNAKVTIDFDFSQQDFVSEVYDPNSVPRSEQSVEEKKEGSEPKDVGGVPGAVSNIGPVQGLESSKKAETYQKSSSTTNYEISKKVINSKDEFAKVKRLTAAVVVDGTYKSSASADGKSKNDVQYIPLSKEQMDAIKDIVKQTIGFNASRGDEVSVSNFEFKKMVDESQNTPAKDFMNQMTMYVSPFLPILKYLLVGLVLFIFYRKMILPLSQKMTSSNDDEALKQNRSFLESDEEMQDQRIQQSSRKNTEAERYANEEALKYDALVGKLKTLSEQKGEEFASLLQSMIRSENTVDKKNSGSKD